MSNFSCFGKEEDVQSSVFTQFVFLFTNMHSQFKDSSGGFANSLASPVMAITYDNLISSGQ